MNVMKNVSVLQETLELYTNEKKVISFSLYGDKPLYYLGAEKNIEEADIIVLNTCVVRQSAEDTATGLLGKLAKQKRKKSIS